MDGIQLEDVSIDTRATSARFEFHHGPETEPLVPPIYHSSTYKLKSVDDYLKILDEVSIKTENKIKSDPDVFSVYFLLVISNAHLRYTDKSKRRNAIRTRVHVQMAQKRCSLRPYTHLFYSLFVFIYVI